ncbi:MAG: DUF4157 domain-containing protein, partial [Gammaproteobacteria bacterium]|nr:DUF4157 domain-containing protein [Gammaproteobacteria bacterium]
MRSPAHSPRGATNLLQLQRVRQLIQPKLTIARANDKYEREADRVADRVVANQPVPQISSVSNAPSSPHSPGLQAETRGDEEQVQPKLLQRQAEEKEEVQPKLLQRQPENHQQEEEEVQPRLIQRQAEEEEEEVQPKLIQRQAEEEEEEVQPKLLQRQAEEEEEEVQPKLLQRQAEDQEEEEEVQPRLIQRRANRRQTEDEPEVQASGSVRSAAASRAVSHPSSGSPIRPDVRSVLESGMGADLSGVRVHQDSAAHEAAASIGAKAFTHKSHIWLGAGQSQSDMHLMAHEATHVVQQGGGRRAAGVSQAAPRVQRIWNPIAAVSNAVSSAVEWVGDTLDSAIDYIKERALEFVQDIPGYSLFTVVNGSDPITGRTVERNGRNFIEAGLDVIPNGEALKQKLEEEGALAEAAAWLDNEIRELDFSPTEIASQFRDFWSSLGIEDATRLPTVLRRLANIVTAPIGRIVRFARNVAVKLLEIIKNYVISSLINFVRERTNAYPLLTVILGRDPISNEPVERTPIALLRGFMQLSESGQEQLRQMEESGSLQRAADWLDGAVARLNLSWETIRESFARAWDLVTIQNLLDPIGTFFELYNIFAGPVGRIINFLIEVAAKVLGFIKDALINRLVEYARTV